MNEEFARIREIEGEEEISRKVYRRLEEQERLEYLKHLNNNMADLYRANLEPKYDENEFINKLIDNIYTILKMFDTMNVYPGFFFRKIYEMNDKYYERISERNIIRDSASGDYTVKIVDGMRGDYKFFKETNLTLWASREIKEGLKEGYSKPDKYPKTNISDAFTEIVNLFKKYGIQYQFKTKEECQKAFSEISINYSNISYSFLTSMFFDDDIQFLCRLLYEYIAFFVSIGVNPKKYLDDYIEQMSKEKHK